MGVQAQEATGEGQRDLRAPERRAKGSFKIGK